MKSQETIDFQLQSLKEDGNYLGLFSECLQIVLQEMQDDTTLKKDLTQNLKRKVKNHNHNNTK